jgi:hypothetical protein
MTNFLPASGATLRYEVSVREAADTSGKTPAGWRTVSPGYLKAIRAPLVAGAWCPELRWDEKAPPKTMVNRRFAELYGQGGNLVGRHMSQPRGQLTEIVGVIGDIKEDALNAPAYPYIYYCATAGMWPDPEYVVRTAGDPRALINSIRQLVRNTDSSRAVFGTKTMEDELSGDLDRPRSNARMVAVFGFAAMGLAAVGLYGLMMQMVNARRQEIGVRMALGARPAQIMRSVVGGASGLAAAGIAGGLGLTVVAQRMLHSLLFGLDSVDGFSMAAAACVLAAVSIVAALLPARRAARIDPIESIRIE